MSKCPFQPIGPAHYLPSEEESQASSRPEPRVAIFYATREGQTKRIAEHIQVGLRATEFDVDTFNVKSSVPFALSNYAGAILAASVHSGSHESEMVQFVRSHRAELEGMATAFLSVSLSEVGAERIEATPAEHARYVKDVSMMLDKFFQQTGWRPKHVMPVAGAIMYTRYNFLLRLIMKRIAKKEGSPTDTSRD